MKRIVAPKRKSNKQFRNDFQRAKANFEIKGDKK
jgi:hypothetical protein